MRVGKLVIAVGVSTCLLGAGATALAASPPKGGKIRVFVTNTSATKAKILVTGAIGDYGTTVSQDANGKTDPNGNFEKVTLKHGGFLVDATALNKKLNSAGPTINKTNCSFTFARQRPDHDRGRHRRLHGNHRQGDDHPHLRGPRPENRQGVQPRRQRPDPRRISVNHGHRDRELQIGRR